LRIVVELDPRLYVAGEAGNGDEGVSQAQALQPDVILLDLSMPGRTGLDALPEIRVVAPAAAVIVFSGLDEVIVGDAVRAAGAALFLQKGSKPDAIIAAIEAVHRGRRVNGGQIEPAHNGGYKRDAADLEPAEPMHTASD
jgi:two-component system invasion response regulator UvrY